MNKHYFDSEKAPVRILTISSLFNEWDNRHLLTEFQQYLNEGFQQFIIDLTNLPIINSVGTVSYTHLTLPTTPYV